MEQKLTIGVVEVWMEKTFEDGFGDGLRVDTGILPRLDDEVDGVLDNSPGDLTSRLVEDKSEMVFG
jgi:hypothetical protein